MDPNWGGAGGLPPPPAMPAGQMHSSVSTTLDEPITTTLMRDLTAIGRKIKVVMWRNKSDTQNELRNWDLWGPLVLCLVLASILGISNTEDAKGTTFAGVFIIMSVGTCVVTLNAQLLGASLSFWQMGCLLGYCLFPLCVAAAVCIPFKHILIVKIAIAGVAWGWAVYASYKFFTGAVRDERKWLVSYPIALFYFFIGWMLVAGI